MRPTCTLTGCHEPAHRLSDVCTDPACFQFTVPGAGEVSAKELARWFPGVVPTCEIVCNDDDGFAREYADQPELVEEVTAFVRRINDIAYIREQHCRQCGAVIVEGPPEVWTVEPGGESSFACDDHAPAGEHGDCADFCSLPVTHEGACA